MEIVSVNNNLVKEYTKLQQKKYRFESGKFLLEGYKVIKEAFDYGIEIENVFVDKKHLSEFNFVQEFIIETNEAVLKKLSTTESSPVAIAIGKQKKYSASDLSKAEKVVLLEDIKDAGNLGTIIRSCVAFGAQGIVLYGDCVDLYNPKCVRAAVGNLWKIPVVNMNNPEELQKTFVDFEKTATLPLAKFLLKNYKPNGKLLLMFGSEANGLSKDLIDISTNSLKIEMRENVESLNLATSVSVTLYKLMD